MLVPIVPIEVLVSFCRFPPVARTGHNQIPRRNLPSTLSHHQSPGTLDVKCVLTDCSLAGGMSLDCSELKVFHASSVPSNGEFQAIDRSKCLCDLPPRPFRPGFVWEA